MVNKKVFHVVTEWSEIITYYKTYQIEADTKEEAEEQALLTSDDYIEESTYYTEITKENLNYFLDNGNPKKIYETIDITKKIRDQEKSQKNSEVKSGADAKELALISAVIIQEDILNGTIFQTFDKSYEIAEEFIKKYPANSKWEELEYDETIINFAKNYIK